MRKPLIAANWKMYKTPAEAVAFIDAFLPLIANQSHAEVVLCPAMTSLAAALAASRERSAETLGQGAAFTRAVAAGWPHLVAPGLPDPVAYPIAAGAATARLGADATTALVAYLTGFCANLIAAGVRLGLCGQSGGVRILAGLTARIVEIAARAAASSLDDLGACAMGSDIAAMRHETLTTRLFIS